MPGLVHADQVISLYISGQYPASDDMSPGHLTQQGGQVVMGASIVQPAVQTKNRLARGISPGLNT